MTAVEIADLLGVKHPETVHGWRKRYATADAARRFPEPFAKLGDDHRPTLVWAKADVLKWAKATGRWPPKPETD